MKTTQFMTTLICAVGGTSCAYEPAPRGGEPVEHQGAIEILIDPGDRDLAEKYYQDISDDLQFQVEGSTLDKLLEHCGYSGLTAQDIEQIPSAILMPSDQAGFDDLANAVTSDPDVFKSKFTLEDFTDDKVLATRYFAPKIIDVNVTEGDSRFKYGWRKLVRLKPRSANCSDGRISDIYLLFNFFEQSTSQDPFRRENVSKNNQVILVRTPVNPREEMKEPVYWLVYGPWDEGGQLAYSLNAAFDHSDPQRPDFEAYDYFVPHACAQCHGGSEPNQESFPTGKLNYLDSDHWFDRIQAGDDFSGLVDSPYGVVFDGGKEQTTERFKSAMNVLRKLNTAIREQNSTPPGGDPDLFQVRAVDKWLEVHANGQDQHVPFMERAISSPDGRHWDADDPVDQALLPLLNRYCFRCHSSVLYHVFDKQAVYFNRNLINEKMRPDGNDPPEMPQDRILDVSVREEILTLVNLMTY